VPRLRTARTESGNDVGERNSGILVLRFQQRKKAHVAFGDSLCRMTERLVVTPHSVKGDVVGQSFRGPIV